MRNLIIGISIFFLFLSGLITIKALGIPAGETLKEIDEAEKKIEDLPPQREYILDKFSREQAANRALVEELQATIARLEDKIAQKNETARAIVQTPGAEEKARVLAVLGSGVFRSGQSVIDENLVNAVNKLVPEILASPDHRVIVEGHTDNMPIRSSSGKRYQDNMELSFLRAKAVALILEKNGIPLERISVTGYGDTRPVASNETDEGRVKNRRVEVKLIPEHKEF